MEIYSKAMGQVMTNGYLIIDSSLDNTKINIEKIDDSKRKCVIIDTPFESFEYYKDLITNKNLELQEIWLTHTHWDHTWDLNKIVDFYKVPVLVNENDIHRLDKPNDYLSFDFGEVLNKMKYDRLINHKDILNLGDLEFEVRHTPGHTEGSVCFINHNSKTIIAGDTLFNSSIGRTDLDGGNYNQLIESIKTNLLDLSDEFKVLSGHGPETTIGFERVYNQFLN